ncbi:MAG TPA: FadR family transcriptional regulator [Candidatus Scatomorpha merdavium]|jgi:GntR family transcriptional repressor for pyruvate dehydrogenase complex|nr:GntR family transcriptional regulator [Oscillospiraceae bacterium]HIS15564.1 FadR family transcriptional regulator [Candidatus Scatomorpha merdavium]
MEFGQIVAPTIKELFVERIEGLIFSGALKPGDKLPSERDLAEQMKISKTIVHLGLEDLARMGFINVTPRRGTVVADFAETGNLETLNAILRYNGGKLDRQMVVSIVELRSAIEGGALIRLGRNHSQQDMEELREMMRQFEEASRLSPDIPAVAAALARFHYKICTLSGNQLFPLIMNAFRGVGSILWESSARFWGEAALYEQGMKIITMIDEGRGEDAAAYLQSLFEHYLENI